jgi:hypothetical protein
VKKQGFRGELGVKTDVMAELTEINERMKWNVRGSEWWGGLRKWVVLKRFWGQMGYMKRYDYL